MRASIALAALLASSTSHALVTDQFLCSLSIKENTTGQMAKQENRFFVARLPVAQPEAYKQTYGNASQKLRLETSRAYYDADFGLVYSHAMGTNPHTGIVEARQSLCAVFNANYCEKTDKACGASNATCATFADPFDPTHGWALVPIIEGSPAFGTPTIGPISEPVTDGQGRDVGLMSISCTFEGTYQ